MKFYFLLPVLAIAVIATVKTIGIITGFELAGSGFIMGGITILSLSHRAAKAAVLDIERRRGAWDQPGYARFVTFALAGLYWLMGAMHLAFGMGVVFGVLK